MVSSVAKTIPDIEILDIEQMVCFLADGIF
jgi:hypothetical protein